MRKFAVLAVLLLAGSLAAAAADAPKIEVFGGYSLLHLDTEGVTGSDLDSLFFAPSGTFNDPKKNYSGWEAAVQFNASHALGIEADFSGHYGTPITVNGSLGSITLPSAKTYNFLFGPVLSLRGEHAKPFVHALFGGNKITIDSSSTLGTGSFSETAFAMALGGGLDLGFTNRFMVRVGQFDYLYTKHNLGGILGLPGAPADHQNNFRISAGLVIGF